MEETLSPGGPADSEDTEALWGQCQRYHTKVNCNNQDDRTQRVVASNTVQIKVMTNTPQIWHMVKAWAADCWYIRAEGDIFVQNYPKILSRFSRDSFNTVKLNRKHREIFAPLLLVPNKKEFGFICVQFQFIRWHPWLDRGQRWL